MHTQKNHTLELLKLLAAYMVVFIHVLFGGKAGIAVEAVARFAVPFFFLVSGYYSYRIPTEKIKKRIRNIGALLLTAAVCCTAFELLRLIKYDASGLSAFLDKLADPTTYIDLLVFNVPVISGHLWYLLAVLYVYVIFYFTTKYRVKETVLFAVSLALLALHLILGEGLSVLGVDLPIPYVRNFALMGIPCFALGLLAKKHEHQCRSVPPYAIGGLIVIGALESVLSRFLVGENELFLGSLCILAALVCVFIRCADVTYPAFWTALEGCSTYIYIFHLMLSTALYILYGILGIDIYSSALLENLHPLAVCVVSTLFAYLLIKVRKAACKNRR